MTFVEFLKAASPIFWVLEFVLGLALGAGFALGYLVGRWEKSPTNKWPVPPQFEKKEVVCTNCGGANNVDPCDAGFYCKFCGQHCDLVGNKIS